MSSNKTITYLATFDELDWKSFGKYSKTLFTDKSDLYDLFQYFKKNKGPIQEGTIDFLKLHQKLRSDLSRKSFQNLLNEFGNQIEKYFSWKEMKVSNYQENRMLLQAFRKRGLFKQYNSLADKMKVDIEKSEEDLWKQYKLLDINHDLCLSGNPIKIKESKEIFRTTINHYYHFTNQLSSFYQCEAANRNRLINEDWSEEINILSSINLPSTQLSDLFDALYQIHNNSETDYLKALNTLESTGNHFSKEIKLATLLYLYNNITRVFESPESQKIYTIRLLNIGLKQDLYLQDSRLPTIRFHNIIDSACGSEKYVWAEKFIEGYSCKIADSIKEQAITLGKAIIHFKNPNILDGKGKAIKILSSQSFSDITLSIRSRAIMICCHYVISRDNKEFMNSQLKAFQSFTKRNKSKMSANGYTSLINLEFFLNKLTNDRNINFEESLKSKSNIFYKSFIMDQIKKTKKDPLT